ncbi:lipopolysaccharide assembly protein LapA domain-containing protein [Sphingomonas aurantiaca]|jgi:uncharacterized integral membrane protein|uniref:Uncharacterized protein DUF1049 n=1 Tax=Sphingomonas aurantiaca TaxID=185949 RepID=A0A2T5GK02_9SPHN|nr:lipopolysaccharide assembly protein LapA domain-containing protein [Sphingomonas aurantiaca]PTQ59658.1 uncharacterized protein DUF1049 [Sphingomonas aurantiaca]
MQFLKILFWCLLAFIAAVFTISNWNTVQIQLWGGLIADVNLPLLLLVTFLIGFVPTMLYNHAIRWRLRQRLATAERSLAELRTPHPDFAPPLAPAQSPERETHATVPPLSAPSAVPPGVA